MSHKLSVCYRSTAMCHLNIFLDLRNWGGDFIEGCEVLYGASFPKGIERFWQRFYDRLETFDGNMARFAKCD